MIYSIIEYKIGVLAMKEEIIKKLKLDIEERERSYQKELQKIHPLHRSRIHCTFCKNKDRRGNAKYVWN